MIRSFRFLVSLITLLYSLSSLAQKGSDPAVTNRNLQPAPLAGIGSPFSMTFSIGNNGVIEITGNSVVNKMGFGICLSKCQLATTNPLDALSGPLLQYFDLSINSATGCIDGKQKDIVIPPTTVFDLYISAVVTEASSNTTAGNIGASCNIAPNPSASPQPTDNDFASIYTYTVTNELPVSLIDFTAQAQPDRSVLLTWRTSWEQANQKYVIERSKDLGTFELIGEVTDVAGTSNSINTYHFVDKDPYRGRSYYRLRQVDQTGTSQTFPAKWVEIEGRYGVYPNPISPAGFNLELDEPQTAALTLVSSQGVPVAISRQVTGETSAHLKPAGPLTSGVYVLKVTERGTTRQFRLVVP